MTIKSLSPNKHLITDGTDWYEVSTFGYDSNKDPFFRTIVPQNATKPVIYISNSTRWEKHSTEILDWVTQNNGCYYPTINIIVFDTEEEVTAFLLRWDTND
jgi:hypothetical protein